MTPWIRRLRGTLGMGLTWAVGWTVAGVGLGVASLTLPWLPWDVFSDVFDAPLPALGVPGFVGGVLYALVVGVAARHRRFDRLSMPRVALWGALGGALLCLVPLVLLSTDLATAAPGARPPWRSLAVVAGPFMTLGALSAAASLWLARRAATTQPLPASRPRGDALRGTPPPLPRRHAQVEPERARE